MSHQDKDRCVIRTNADCLQQALRWLLRHVQWSGIQFRDDWEKEGDKSNYAIS